eukprot:m51a1_g4701 hypothetical protein (277) ;mRNA; f:232514-235171
MLKSLLSSLRETAAEAAEAFAQREARERQRRAGELAAIEARMQRANPAEPSHLAVRWSLTLGPIMLVGAEMVPGRAVPADALERVRLLPRRKWLCSAGALPSSPLRMPDEWQRLAAMCLELADHVAACNTPRTTQFAGYCRDVAGLVREVDAYAHCDMSVRANAEAAQTFFSACFWITKNCSSGHPYSCRGWLSRLYFASVEEPVVSWLRVPHNVLDFPTHMGRVAWRNEESGRMFCMCTGLFYSTLSDDGAFLLPCYGQLQYEIRSETLFKQLAN